MCAHIFNNSSVVEITTSSPLGMQFTSLRYHQGVYYRNVTWYPNQYQFGQNLFCFQALDSNGWGLAKREKTTVNEFILNSLFSEVEINISNLIVWMQAELRIHWKWYLKTSKFAQASIKCCCTNNIVILIFDRLQSSLRCVTILVGLSK